MTPAKKKWLNGCIYPCKKIGYYPQLYFERTMIGTHRGISMSLFEEKGKEGITISFRKPYANLMLKRLKMVLED